VIGAQRDYVESRVRVVDAMSRVGVGFRTPGNFSTVLPMRCNLCVGASGEDTSCAAVFGFLIGPTFCRTSSGPRTLLFSRPMGPLRKAHHVTQRRLPSYLSSPLQCLVHSGRLDETNHVCERCQAYRARQFDLNCRALTLYPVRIVDIGGGWKGSSIQVHRSR
jgi:hypothetical protein